MKLQDFPTSTGYSVKYRVLPPDTWDKIEAAIRTEWREAGKEPKPPINVVDTEDGPVERVNDKHPDYLQALAEYDRAVNRERAERIAALCLSYATVFEVDEELVTQYRAAMAAQGVHHDTESDREVFLWRIAVPDELEQQRLTSLILGSRFAAAVEAQQRAFRRTMERYAAGVPDAAEGQSDV